MTRTDSAPLATQLQEMLDDRSVEGGGGTACRTRTFKAAIAIVAEIGPFKFVVCARLPRKPYEPMAFQTMHEGQKESVRLAAVLCPEVDATQEYYLNTNRFHQ
jgi:hypothetical protein